MKDHTDITSFSAAVDAIPLMGSTTRIDRALRLTQKELFAKQFGAREKNENVLILLTDGSQTQVWTSKLQYIPSSIFFLFCQKNINVHLFIQCVR